MRFKITFIPLLLCSTITFSQKRGNKGLIDAQYECFYSITFISDTIKMTQGAKNGFILRIGDGLTYGCSYRDYDWKALFWTEEGFATVMESFKNGTRSTFFDSDFVHAQLYKDYVGKRLSVVDHISIHFFIYEDNLTPQNWIVRDDTMTIAGYACQKAVCEYRGRSYEAWFAPEIPISEGPWKFYGLPGLIIKLYDSKNHYDFELVEFKTTDKKIDIQPLSAKKATVMGRTVKLTKIERKEFLEIKFGEKGHLMMNADIAKIGLSSPEQIEKKYGYIELDY